MFLMRDFTVGAAGSVYYVNDGQTAGDQYSTAVGNNANSGTSPADPMASLNAVLNVYDLGPGDVVYVDVGTYALPANIRVTAQDSGVTIQGPVGGAAGQAAVFDRGNTASGAGAWLSWRRQRM